MRKLFCIFMTSTAIFQNLCFSLNISHAKVNELYEMTSIVWGLAGADEYSQCAVKEYAADIRTYFSAYNQHPLIDYCKRIRKRYGIAYDAISTSTAFLYIDGDSIRCREGVDSKMLAKTDLRWRPDDFERYTELLDDFYRYSGFHVFYDTHKPLYERAEVMMDSIMEGVIEEKWFEDFYGTEFTDISMYISVNNGMHNYALANVGFDSENGVLIGCLTGIGRNNMKYARSIRDVIIHEVSHIFANPVIKGHIDDMNRNIKELYKYSANTFAKYGVGCNEGLIYEWLTRLFTLMYLDRDGILSSSVVNYEVTSDVYRGFIWQWRAFEFMSHFNAHRDRYRTINDFMPQLVSFLDYTTENLDHVIWEYENRRPYIVSVFPSPYSDLKCYADTVTIKVKFSEEMHTGAEGLSLLVENRQNSEAIVTSGWYSKDTYMVKCPCEWVHKTGLYGFKLSKDFFQSKRGISMAKDEKIIYKHK